MHEGHGKASVHDDPCHYGPYRLSEHDIVQVKRLKMYNSGKAVRNKKGRIVSQELQSKELPSTRIVPDRRWFGNTRVIGQKQLTSFREQMADKVDNPFMVLLKGRKLPTQARTCPLALCIAVHPSDQVKLTSMSLAVAPRMVTPGCSTSRRRCWCGNGPCPLSCTCRRICCQQWLMQCCIFCR
jgi:hypothetical protein